GPQIPVRSPARARGRRRAPVVLPAPLQVRLDEGVELAVEDRLDVARLVPRALVLHELIRRERVAADLTPERDVLLLARQRLELLLPFEALPFGKTRRENLQCLGAVLDLRPLVLNRYDDAGGKVRYAHRGERDVEVL